MPKGVLLLCDMRGHQTHFCANQLCCMMRTGEQKAERKCVCVCKSGWTEEKIMIHGPETDSS